MSIKILLLDVGGVLLTNGWDRSLRAKAARDFSLNFDDIQRRHDTVFEFLERGNLTLNDYLQYVIFYQRRAFSLEDFRVYMMSQVQAYLPVMNLMESLKEEYKVRIVLFSNETKELADDRFGRFPFFKHCVDAYIISGYVRLRKPDMRMYQLALSISLVKPEEIVLVDDRPQNLVPAAFLGMHTIQHLNVDDTTERLHGWLK